MWKAHSRGTIPTSVELRCSVRLALSLPVIGTNLFIFLTSCIFVEYSMTVRSQSKIPSCKYCSVDVSVCLISSISADLSLMYNKSSACSAYKHVVVHSLIVRLISRSSVFFFFLFYVSCVVLLFGVTQYLIMYLYVSRKKGVVLNISSASGMYPVPLLTVYSASKVIIMQCVNFSSRVNQSVFLWTRLRRNTTVNNRC